MDPRHKELIMSQLSGLVGVVNYKQLRPFLLLHRVFSPTQLARLDERSEPGLELFLEVQRRGPSAFRRLLASLKLAGQLEAVKMLSKDVNAGGCQLDGSLYLDEQPAHLISANLSLDLTDSPIQPHHISVSCATELRGEDPMTYRMVCSPRGLALIIDNEDFDTLPPRRGSHVDSACLTRLFQQLGFWVVLRRNLGRASLEFELMNFATDNIHLSLDMAVVCILSHGENGTIICCNGEQVAIEDILRRFNNREAPALRGKPKYFLFQSCRGLDIDFGVEVDGPHHRQSSGGETLEDQQFSSSSSSSQYNFLPQLQTALERNPCYEDMIISFATIPGYVAYRNNVKGSWFIQCFCKVFMEHAQHEDLLTLLLRVSQAIRLYSTTKGEKQMCETLLRGVYKKIYFNPGLSQPTHLSKVLVQLQPVCGSSLQDVWGSLADGRQAASA